MRDTVACQRIKELVHQHDIIEIRRHAHGRDYYCGGMRLNGQHVRDLIADGWLIEGDSSLRLAS